MIIEKIELINFQKHEHLVIDFTNGINIITGVTDVGKSSVFRALQWVVFNKLVADKVRRTVKKKLTKETKVILTINGKVITRCVNNKENYYELDGKRFSALGRSGVPDEITSALNMDEVNFQGQFAPPFLVGENSGDISKILNSLVNLDEMDRLAQKENADLRKLSEKKNELTTKLTELNNRVFPDTSSMQKLYDDCVLLTKSLEILSKEHTTAGTIAKKYSDISSKMDACKPLECKNLLEKADIICNYLKDNQIKYSEYKKHKANLDRLANIKTISIDSADLERGSNLCKELTEKENSIKNYKKLKLALDIVQKQTIITIDKSLVERGEILSKSIVESSTILSKIINCKNKLSEVKNKMVTIEIDLNKANEELKAFDVCPTCGQIVGACND